MPTKCAPHNDAHPGPLSWCLPKGVVIWCCPAAWKSYFDQEVLYEMKQNRLKALKNGAV